MALQSRANLVDLITDRNIYSAGENIWFSARMDEPESAVLYVDLTNIHGELFAKGKYQPIESRAEGALKVAADLRTGVYFVRAYTKGQLSSTNPTITTVEVLVVNHQSAPLAKMKSCPSKSALTKKTLEIESQIKDGRAKLNFPDLEKGSYNVTVVPRNSFDSEKQNLLTECEFPGAQSFGFMEKRSTTLKGRLVDPKNRNPIANTMIVGSTMGKQPELHLARTDENGQFILVFRTIESADVLYLLAPEIKESETKFLVDQEFPELKLNCETQNVVISDSLVAILNRVSFNSKMNNAYGEENLKVIDRIKIPEPFKSPTEEIVLADYIALGSMKEVFKELVPYSAVREKDGKQFITIYDHQYHKSLENPLVLLDNVPFIDHDDILRLAPSKIKSIRVIANPYYHGDEKINGVISIHSKNGRLGGLELPKSVELIDFSGYEDGVKWDNTKDLLPGQAELSNTLYWNPQAKVIDSGLEIEFEIGQHQGEFDVIVIDQGQGLHEIMKADLLIEP